MGLMANVDLFEKIIECTPAKTDQEHLRLLSTITLRCLCGLPRFESQVKELIRSAQFLESAGADILAMACNTAHYWHQDVQNAVNVKLVNIIEITADYLEKHRDWLRKNLCCLPDQAPLRQKFIQKSSRKEACLIPFFRSHPTKYILFRPPQKNRPQQFTKLQWHHRLSGNVAKTRQGSQPI